MTRAKSPTMSDTGQEGPEQYLAPSETSSLPSEHLNHTAVFENEIQGRLHGFRSGIIALQGEIEGAEAEHQRKLAEQNKAHEEWKGNKLRLIGDLQRAERMATAALDAAEEGQ